MQFTLQKGPLSAAVDTKGGELISFRDGAGTEYIWNGDLLVRPQPHPVPHRGQFKARPGAHQRAGI